MRFVVAGLPRSRTKWVSAFLSTPDCPCLHDTDESEFGLSSTTILYKWESIPKDVPIAFIHRPLTEIVNSLSEFKLPFYSYKDLEDRAKAMITARKVLVLDFHNLNAKALWKHCYNSDISDDYIKVYTDMNIQQQKVEDMRRVA